MRLQPKGVPDAADRHTAEINATVRESLRAHVLSCFRHVAAKQISVGEFLDFKAAVDYLADRA